MKIIGIICEYNPFHNGHKYQIDKIKQLYPDSLIVCIMSGNFTQRGTISILEKYDKTSIALNCGVDLVIELPIFYATQSADVFAKGAVKIASIIGCNMICFGAEHTNLDFFYKNINISELKEYDIEVKKLLKEGLNYPTATSLALDNLGGNKIDTPNDILALRYIKEIMKNNYNIEPLIIERTNNYHDIELDCSIVSASNIREKLNNNIDIKEYVPIHTYNKLKNNYVPDINNYYNIFKYTIILNKESLTDFIEMDKSLAKRFIKYIYSSNCFDDFVNNVKTKNYTTCKINRVILHVLINLKSKNDNIYSLRVLGFNNKGKKYLNKFKKQIRLITKFSDLSNNEKDYELLTDYIYFYNSFDYKNTINKKVIYTRK